MSTSNMLATTRYTCHTQPQQLLWEKNFCMRCHVKTFHAALELCFPR